MDRGQQLGSLLLTYFQNMFSTEGTQLHHLDNISFTPLKTANKTYLAQLYTDEEIEVAVWKLGAWKAPGLDGIPIDFYRENSNLVGAHILQIVHNLLTAQEPLQSINAINLVLIPKIKHPQTPVNFRPIVLYYYLQNHLQNHF